MSAPEESFAWEIWPLDLGGISWVKSVFQKEWISVIKWHALD